MLKEIKFLLEKNKYVKQLVLYSYVNTYGKYKDYKENKNFLLNADKVLVRVNEVFTELNMKYWLDFGTLLGAVRHGDFLKHDLDIDLGVYANDYTPNLKKKFIEYGFKKIKDFTIDDGNYGREETYEYLGVQVDVFYYIQKTKTEAYYHDFTPLPGKSRDKTILERGGLVPREITLALEGIEFINFLGKKYPIPKPANQHLSNRYGKDFMIENKSWSLGKEKNPNIKILTDKIGIRKLYD